MKAFLHKTGDFMPMDFLSWFAPAAILNQKRRILYATIQTPFSKNAFGFADIFVPRIYF